MTTTEARHAIEARHTAEPVDAAKLTYPASVADVAGLVDVAQALVARDRGLLAIDESTHTCNQRFAARCEKVTEAVLWAVFAHLVGQRVILEAMILKPNMVLPGSACPTQDGVDEVADATLRCLRRAVPAAVPGVAFLSGGQPAELASARLKASNQRATCAPWTLTFSFARAIQHPALEIWGGHDSQITAAQDALYHRARCNQAACRGEYQPAMETTERS